VPIQVIVVPHGRRHGVSRTSSGGSSVGAGGHSASGHIMGVPATN
jgi:hypothetical protein